MEINFRFYRLLQRYAHGKYIQEKAIISRVYSTHIQLRQKVQQFSEPVSVLEIGCGDSDFASKFSPECYLGCDISFERVEAARLEHHGYQFIVADVTDAKFEKIVKDFEFIFCIGLLHHIDDNSCKQLMENIRLYAKKPATFIAMEPVLPVIWQNPLGFLLCKLDQGRFIRTPQAAARFFRNGASLKIEKLKLILRWPVGIIAYIVMYK